MAKVYDPKDENDPVWPEFDRWLKKYRAGKEKQAQKRASTRGVPPSFNEQGKEPRHGHES